MRSTPARANPYVSWASWGAERPSGLSTVHRRGLSRAPVSSRSPAMPRRGPRSAASSSSGHSRSAIRVPDLNEILPNRRFRSCGRSPHTASGSNEMTAREQPRPSDSTDSTRPATRAATSGGTASAGSSTVCSSAMSRALAAASRLEQARWYVTRRRMVIAVTLDVSVGARHRSPLCDNPGAGHPGRSPAYPYSTGRLVPHAPGRAHRLRLCTPAARRGRRGVMYDTVLATGRLGGRRRVLARRSPSRGRGSLARPGARRRLAGGAGRARVLDVQAGRRGLVTVVVGGRSSGFARLIAVTARTAVLTVPLAAGETDPPHD